MKSRTRFILPVLLLLAVAAPMVSAVPEKRQETGKDALAKSDSQIAMWISQLDSKRFTDRERSARALTKAGSKALPAVLKATRSKKKEPQGSGDAKRADDPYDVLYDMITLGHAAKEKAPKGVVSPLRSSNAGLLTQQDAQKTFIKAIDTFGALSDKKIQRYSEMRRALLQRHVWAVFDSTTQRRHFDFRDSEEEKAKLVEIQRKLAPLIRRLALSKKQILALPDSLTITMKTGAYPTTHDPKNGFKPFLPSGLYDTSGSWVCLSKTHDPIPARFHSKFSNWRSVFLVFMRLPGDRKKTLSYLQKLANFREPIITDQFGNPRVNPKTPQFPIGTQVAIVERAMLISEEGELVLSPLTFRIQLRAYLNLKLNLDPKRTSQAVAEFVAYPKQLMEGTHEMKAIGDDQSDLATVPSAIDAFQTTRDHKKRPRLQTCVICHGAPGIHSIGSRGFQTSNMLPARFKEGKLDRIATSTSWAKRKHYSWGLLKGLWLSEK